MLNGDVGKVEFCTNCANILTCADAKHSLNPIGRNNLCIVIQQQEIVALGVSNAKVHEFGEIEFVLPSYKTNDVRIFCLQLIVIIERLLFCAVVFDYNKLENVVR